MGDRRLVGGGGVVVVRPLLNGREFTAIGIAVATAGTTNASTFQLRRLRSGSAVNMLTSALSLASGASTSTTETIDTANDDLATGDLIYADIKTLSTTVPKGGIMWAEFT